MSGSSFGLTRLHEGPKREDGTQSVEVHIRCACPREHVVHMARNMNAAIPFDDFCAQVTAALSGCPCVEKKAAPASDTLPPPPSMPRPMAAKRLRSDYPGIKDR